MSKHISNIVRDNFIDEVLSSVETKRFVQKQDFFIDTEDLNISYACANKIDCKNIVNKLNQLSDENERLKEENEELISMNNDLAKELFKRIEFTEEDLQQAWEEVKEEIKNKPFDKLFKEIIGGKNE